MTAETWAAIVFHRFDFPSSLKYGRKQLHKAVAVALDRRLAGLVDLERVQLFSK
jgi:hypothetical protein